MRIKPFRTFATVVILGIIATVLAACGSNDTAVVAPPDDAAPVESVVNITESVDPVETESNRASVPESTTPKTAPQAVIQESRTITVEFSFHKKVRRTPIFLLSHSFKFGSNLATA